MRTLALSVALLALPTVAAAGDCVTLDADRDSLSADEQRAAVLLLEDTIASTQEGCAAAWTVSHVRLGEAVTVRLSRQGASQQLSVSQVEELPVAYERLVRALQTGQPVSGTADRDSVTTAEQSPRRVEADTLVYAQLGGGISGFERPEGGTAFGFGYRHALDNMAIDISGLNTIIPADPDGSEQLTLTLVELSALYYTDGGAARSAYFGGGVGYGLGVTEDGGKGGLQLQGTAGYELLRHSTIRVFPQLDVTLPMYQATQRAWLPSATMTLNVAFTPPEDRTGGIRILR